MNKIILELHQVLNLIKGFTTGYSGKNKEQMVILQDKSLYRVTFELIKEDATFEDLSEECKKL